VFLGLRTAIYPAPDLAKSKAWYTQLLGFEPYFDEPFFVGFNVAGYELALNPNADPAAGVITYWGVADIEVGMATLVAAGATVHEEVQDVGEGIRVATVRDPSDVILGIIENPHFELTAPPGPTDGPGR
jgi:predicted enzyme related to lactoylglutathione lyase